MVAQDSNAQSEAVDVYRFDRETWGEVVGSTDYSEDQERVSKPEDEPSQAASKPSDKRVKHQAQPDSGADNSDSSGFSLNTSIPFNYIIYALVAGVIIYILFLIIRNISVKSDRTIISNKASHNTTASIEDIQELETDRLLREAIASGDYRLAVRVCFLGLLKSLDEGGVIKWKKDKTNRDYLSELHLKQYFFDEIRRLTINYEQVWYGEHELSLPAYEEVIGEFKKMGDKLNSSKSA